MTAWGQRVGCGFAALGLCAAALSVEAAAPAVEGTTLFVHGHIYTADPSRPWAEALAVSGSRIAAVGADRELTRRWQTRARVIDLHGATVIPGIIDAHMHLLFGALEIAGFNLSNPKHSVTPADPAALVAAIQAFATAHPADRILIGRSDFSSQQPTAPTFALLDQAVSDRPVIVHNTTEHSLWLNSKALALAGITDQPVSDPEEERYVIRDANGHPTGVLLEAAQELGNRATLREFSTEEKLALIRNAARYLNRLGITSIVNATGNLAEIELYGTLRDRGELTLRTRTAFGSVAVQHRLTPQLLADLESARTRFHDEWVSANLVKFFVDGSSGMYPPLVYHAPDYLALVEELDRRGFQIMTHAERKDSVHLALDAYENALRKNGPRDRRSRIEHDFVISDEDAVRQGTLKVITGAQPAFCCSDVGTNFDPGDPTASDRWRTLLSAHATLAFSSDWPCLWPPDPFMNMQQAVTRQIWRSPDTAVIETAMFDGAKQGGSVPQPGKVYFPEERITIGEAVDAYTRGAAYASFFDDRVGTLKPGMLADLAVLSQNIFTAPAVEIANTHAALTMVGGKIVYEEGAAR